MQDPSYQDSPTQQELFGIEFAPPKVRAHGLRDALESGDELAAKRLKDQVPGVHIGPHNVARAERGVVLERTATAQAVEDGNQEIKSDREEVEKMEGMLWRASAMVVQVAKQLAVKVRERFERSRGRDGPDHGWSR